MINISAIKDLYPFESRALKIKDYNYHYVDEGKGDAPIVMVHGNPTWSFYYRNLIKEFSKTNRVVAPDNLGCGLSDKPQNFQYRLETHIDNLETLLLTLNLENITLIVHDWGGAIGMGFAVRHPQKIAKLIILNSAAFSMDWIPWRIAICRLPWLDDKLVRNANLFVRAAMHMTTVKPLPEQVKQGYMLPFQTYDDRIAVLRFVQDIPLTPEHVSYEVLLEIEHGLWMFREIPVGIIWGMQDWCFTSRFLDRWKLYYPQAQILELTDAGHLALEDAPREAANFIRRILLE
ncbi:MAG: alpha/beta fold hydrolase [Victivallaceae bacterium]